MYLILYVMSVECLMFHVSCSQPHQQVCATEAQDNLILYNFILYAYP